MGAFHVSIAIGDPEGRHFEPLEALVDRGATYTGVPRSVLEGLGHRSEEEWEFILADGRSVLYGVKWVLLRLDNRIHPTPVVFGEDGTEPLVGVFTLEGFRLGVDAVNQRLIPPPGLLKGYQI